MNDDVDLEEIPREQTSNFPTGVSEVLYDSDQLMDAFVHGICSADCLDVNYSQRFTRNGKIVIRVKVGNWDVEDHGDNDCPDSHFTRRPGP